MRFRTSVIWLLLCTVIVLPIIAAAKSPLLAWRDPVYVLAGFAGVIALSILLLQPILAKGHLPGLSARLQSRIHLKLGIFLLICVVIHVAGLWVTSPPDMIDALLFTSPTAFSIWGVVSMWCIFGSAGLIALRRRLRLQPQNWRRVHRLLAAVIVTGSIIHAMLIEGTMEILTKSLLCTLVALATVLVLVKISRKQ